MATFRRIGVLTSGGDAQGMNAAIRAVTYKALAEGIEVMGIRGGYSGLIKDDLAPLTYESVRNIVGQAGTALYSDRCKEFMTEEGMQKAIDTCRKHNIDAIVALGGDGTFRGATDLTLHGIPTVGIPCTIDNDITATEYSIGFDTAMNMVVSLLEATRDTSESHNRVAVVETMGRGCGDIALNTAIATGAIAAIIPEEKCDEAALMEKIRNARAAGQRSMLVVVSEGVFNPDGTVYGEPLTKRIEAETGCEARFLRLAHVQRGGNPTLRDRQTAAAMGVKAVELLLEGKSNLIVSEWNGQLTAIETTFALAADRMYKNKLKDGDLDKFTAEQIEEMKAMCEKRAARISRYYAIANTVG